MSGQTIYKTAFYLRLSRDDMDIDGRSKVESNSISSQRDLLNAYVRGKDEFEAVDTYIDDGYSGADFERPEFQRMLGDIYTEKINCVIVKDLSRFGRDYIEAGRYIQKTFPVLGVRFIAVTDNFDSLLSDRTEASFVLPVKNFVNDSYCRDISVKVRAHQKVKRLDGKCIAAFAVYGYQKDPEDKNHLIVDEYAAGIVRKIYELKIAGMSYKRIAEKLNDYGILSPMEYKKFLGMNYSSGFEKSDTPKWSVTSVKRILTNRVYMGHMEQGKQEKISYKVKKRILKPEEEWIRVENTHEAIISEDDFNLVQELLRFDGRASADTGTANMFCGILICADCKAPMVKRANNYKGRKRVYYICQTKNKSQGCSRHSIPESDLKDIVLREIKVWMNLMISYSEIMESIQGEIPDCGQLIVQDTQIEALQKEYDKYYGLRGYLLADLQEGRIDKEEFDEFHEIYTGKCKEIENSIEKQKALTKKIYEEKEEWKERLERYRKTAEVDELTRELLVTMISKIYVHEDKSLDIVFRFKNELEKMKEICEISRNVDMNNEITV